MKRMDTFLKLSPIAAARINNHAETAIAAAFCRVPMVTKPLPWSMGITDGAGYLTSYSPLSLFKTTNRDLLEEIRNIDDPMFQHFIDGHNVASQSGFIIDQDTLRLLKKIVHQGVPVAKIPAFIVEAVECPLLDSQLIAATKALKGKPEDMSNKDYLECLEPRLAGLVKRLLRWRSDKREARQKAVERAGARSNLLRTLEIAEEVKDFKSIYFPTQSDDRGRVYYATPLLNPQGADHEKALLLFDTAKPIGESGWNWLRINVSNLMGFDKANFEDRITYVEEHREMIESCVKDPLGDLRWETTDKPFQFLQASRELVKCWQMEDPTKFESRVGVAADASCSGLQILGTLTRCRSSMKFTNCLPAERDQDGKLFMQDIYGEAARIATDKTKQVAAGNLKGRNTADEEVIQKDQENANKLLSWAAITKDGGYGRSWLKRNTMTFFYGSARFGMRQQQITDFMQPEYDKALAVVGKGGDVTSTGFPWENMKDAGNAATLAGNINYDAICDMAEKPSQVMTALQKYAELIAKGGKKMRWRTPLGLIVEQRYEKVEKFKIDSMVTGQKRMQTTTQRGTGEVDSNGQKNGAAPNWVHGTDASLLLLAVSTGQKKYGLNHWRLVHDSFAVHACDTEIMVNHLKNTMADMLDKDFLVRTAEELTAQVPEELREEILPFPELGDESLVDQLRIAEFPFC